MLCFKSKYNFIVASAILLLSANVKSQPGCIKVKLESDFPHFTARLGQDIYIQRLWSNASFTTLRITHPSFERPVFQLIHKPFLAVIADTIVPHLVNGVWLSERVVSWGFVFSAHQPGPGTISFP